MIWHDTPFIEYEQLRLNSNFRQYLETSVIPKKIFRMGTQKTSLQKWNELAVGAQSYSVEFIAAHKEFDWLEIFLVNDKSGQHKMVCNIFHAELSSTTIQNVTIKNTSNTYSIANDWNMALTTLTENISYTNNFLPATATGALLLH